MSGVEEGGGEPSSGIPPTKKAPTACRRRSLHGSFNLSADVIGSELTRTREIIPPLTVKARAKILEKQKISRAPQVLILTALNKHGAVENPSGPCSSCTTQ